MFYQANHFGSSDYIKTEKNENFSFPPHMHMCFEIILLLSGTMLVTVDGREFLVKEGQAVLIFPNQVHSLKSEKSKHVLSIFSPKLVQAYEKRVLSRLPENNVFTPESTVAGMLEHIEEAGFLEKKGVLYLACAQFDKNAVYKDKKADSASLLKMIFNFVENEYREECSLKRLAEDIGYDYTYLSRYFKKTVGLSFNFYVNAVRLSHACYCIDNTNDPIIKCAYDSGFTSLRTFNRNFKQLYGITPNEYKERKR